MNKLLLGLALSVVLLPAVQAQFTSEVSPPKQVNASLADKSDKLSTDKSDKPEEFQYIADRFADAQVLRYQVAGWNTLTLKQKELVYYLYQAALSGRDMTYDQNYKHNLKVRRTLEVVLTTFNGPKKGPDWEALQVYAKRVFFSNGIHHHYSMKKFVPDFNAQYLSTLIYGSDAKQLPLAKGESIKDFIATMTPVILDATKDAKRVSLDGKKDLITNSAMNYYDGVTQK